MAAFRIEKYKADKPDFDKEVELAMVNEKQPGKTTIAENPVYQAYMKAFVEHLKQKGILDQAYYEVFDEAYFQDHHWNHMLRHHKALKKLVPELKLFSFGVNPTTVCSRKNAVGALSCWAPHLFECANPEILEAVKKRQKENGEEFWFYTCTERMGSNGKYSPFICYDRPYQGIRLHPWYAWQLGADGFLAFALTGLAKQDLNKNPEDRWPNKEWHDSGGRGSGTLIYPGPEPDIDIIPGMRLANLRDGMEDYEYFHKLAILKNRLDPGKDAKLIAAAGRELKIEPEIINGVYEWTEQQTLLDAKRERLARLIVAIQDIINKKGVSEK